MDQFVMTDRHIKLLRAAKVGWQNCEAGAPEIDPKRPYGNSDVESDVRVLVDSSLSDEDASALHRETEMALQIVLSCGTFEPGTFERKSAYGRAWQRVKGE